MKREPIIALLNGNLITVSGGREEALLIKGDRIATVGSSEKIRTLAPEDAEIIDLNGKTVLPGFIDAHTHFVFTGLATAIYLDLEEARSLEELLELVRAEVRRRSQGEWIIGRRWDESLWPEKRYVSKADLDKVAPKNPVALFRVDGHLLSVNSIALAEVELPPTLAECDEKNGWLREETAWWFYDQIEPGLEEIKQALLTATTLAHSLGVTSIHDIVKPIYIRAYQELRDELRLRVYLCLKVNYIHELISLGLGTGFGDEWLKLGAIKLFADGSIGASNAALYEPYKDRGASHISEGRGKLNHDNRELGELVRKAQENGFQMMVHAIGDRAIDSALDAFAREDVERDDRYRIEHFELATESQIERAAKLGVIASMQPNFVKWSGRGGLYEMRLGKDRAERIGPHRRVLDSRITLAFGSDCMPFSPLFGIHQAVNAPHEIQRLSVEEAILCYTLNGAYASFEEELKGSIAEGKLADLVVLSKDPHEFPDEIAGIEVEMTFISGRRVFNR